MVPRNDAPRSVHRLLSGEERRLWERAIADVRPIVTRQRRSKSDTPGAGAHTQVVADVPPPRPTAPPLGPPAGSRTPAPVSHASRVVAPAQERAPGAAPGLDARTLTRLKRGRIAPQARIDLHHCTQEEAHRLLDGFLAASQANGCRCVLVITGKGYGPGGAVGVLKTMVPRWLNEPRARSLVLAFSHAAPLHGGEGALYVLLRRPRRPPA